MAGAGLGDESDLGAGLAQLGYQLAGELEGAFAVNLAVESMSDSGVA